MSDLLEEENTSVKDLVTDTETLNGDSSDMLEDILFKIDLDMLLTYMPGKDTMEPISMHGIEIM